MLTYGFYNLFGTRMFSLFFFLCRFSVCVILNLGLTLYIWFTCWLLVRLLLSLLLRFLDNIGEGKKAMHFADIWRKGFPSAANPTRSSPPQSCLCFLFLSYFLPSLSVSTSPREYSFSLPHIAQSAPPQPPPLHSAIRHSAPLLQINIPV